MAKSSSATPDGANTVPAVVPIPRPSPNCDDRAGTPVDMVVLHYTGMATGEAALRRLTDPAPCLGSYRADIPAGFANGPDDEPLPPVSAHYVVDVDGTVFALVDEAHRAWHAGVASWAGAPNINHRSIGIEIVNGGEDFPGPDGFPPPYTAAQLTAVCALVADIVARHHIPPWRVLGHSDVAPGRKRDPGPHFPWPQLAKAGLALAGPDTGNGTTPNQGDDHAVMLRLGAAGEPVRQMQRQLAAFGYGIIETGGYDERTRDVVSAFQHHFSPQTVSSPPSDAAAPDNTERIETKGRPPTDGGVWTRANQNALDTAFLLSRHHARLADQAGVPFAQPAPDLGG